jgi:ABC-type uncharacterized transport system ATPase subunit
MTMDDAAILARGLSKRYGETVAVDSLDLRIERGEVFGLLGPNGAGKTTTILMLLGRTEPTGGSVRIVGLDPTRQAIEAKAQGRLAARRGRVLRQPHRPAEPALHRPAQPHRPGGRRAPR